MGSITSKTDVSWLSAWAIVFMAATARRYGP